MNLNEEKMICAPWTDFSKSVITLRGGVEHLYSQYGHTGYLLIKSPVEIAVYTLVSVTPSVFQHMLVLAVRTAHAWHQTIQMKIQAVFMFKSCFR